MTKPWCLLFLAFGFHNLCCSFLHVPQRGRHRPDGFGVLFAEKPPVVVVVGGGWAGFSATEALSSSDVEVVMLDASPRGQGGLAGGWRTPLLKRPVEAGLHGFWREYRNTYAAIKGIEGIHLNDILTPYTPSVLISESGRVALAPVLGEEEGKEEKEKESDKNDNNDNNENDDNNNNPVNNLQNLKLPPPLDIALLAEFADGTPLSVLDRISAVGLLAAWVDFGQEDPRSWERYDGVSAEQLFLALAGVTPTLYRELVTPLLHVLPMTPGYDCSAAAALSCFHVFALQSRGAFDVRWCRGTIAESIFNPWTRQLLKRGNVSIRGSSRVTSIARNDDGTFGVTVNAEGTQGETLKANAVVMAIGGTAMKRLLPSCPPLQQLPVSKTWDRLRGVTCVAVRLFLRPHPTPTVGLLGGMHDSTELPPSHARAMKDSPVFVCGPRVLPELAETGFCIYDLQRLHDEFAVAQSDASSSSSSCAALEIDFFRANAVANIQDDQAVANLALQAVGKALGVKPMDPTNILDVSVVRARDAVSHFCVGSASSSPGVKLDHGLYICGDWIDRTGHASWSTEKAVVTGRQAVQALAEDFQLDGCETNVIPAASDGSQLSALRDLSKRIREASPVDWGIPPAPWVASQQLRQLSRRQR